MSDEIQRSLGRIEGKLDMAIEKITTLEEKHESQGMRVSSLEGTRSYAFGVVAAIAATFGIIGSYVGKALASVFVGH